MQDIRGIPTWSPTSQWRHAVSRHLPKNTQVRFAIKTLPTDDNGKTRKTPVTRNPVRDFPSCKASKP